MVQISPRVEATDSAKVLQKKREILEAASTVFRSQGVHAATMRDIAIESRMHVGNLYYYFHSKQELLAFCQKDSLDGLADIASRIERLPAAGPDTRLALLVIGHFVLLNETRPGSTAHIEVEAVSEPWLAEIIQLRHAYETVFHRVILAGQKQGVFRQADPETIALAVLGALNWSAKWFRPQGKKSAVEIGCEFADYLVRGLLAAGKTLTQLNPDDIARVTQLQPNSLPSLVRAE